jgi:hypothetical protein
MVIIVINETHIIMTRGMVTHKNSTPAITMAMAILTEIMAMATATAWTNLAVIDQHPHQGQEDHIKEEDRAI